LQMAQSGKFELLKFEPTTGNWRFAEDVCRDHPSNLSEKAFRSLAEDAMGEGEGSVEDVLAFNPEPKQRRENPNAVLLLTSQEAAGKLRARQTIDILGHSISVFRPDSDRLRRALSSRGGGSEAPSEAASVAGSQNSHTSVQSQPGESRPMTLLFDGIPEDMYNSEAQKPAAKQSIEAFVKSILKDAPVNPSLFTCSASFTTPKKAPPGGCWMNFQYTVKESRINPEDGKSYTYDAFKKLYQDSIDGTPNNVALKWQKCRDSIQALEKSLADQDGPRISIARWFMDKVRSKYPPVDVPWSSQPKTLVACDGIQGTLGGGKLSVQWKRL